jgi:glycerol kinase
MTRCVLSLDQGTTSSRAILFDGAGKVHRLGPGGVPPALPGARLGGARPRGPLGDDPARRAGGPARRRASGRGEVAAVGIANQRETTLLWERAGGRPLHRAIVWQDRRTAGACGRSSAADSGRSSGEGRGSCSTPISRGPSSRGSWTTSRGRGAGRAGRARLRDRGHLAPLEADTRARARDGRLQRLAHPPRRPQDRGVGPRSHAALRIPEEVLPEIRPSSGSSARSRPSRPCEACRSRASRATSRPRCSARGASARAWPRTPTGTGCFMLMNTGSRPVRLAAPAPLHDRLADWRAHRVRPRGQRVRGRRRRPVAARRPRADRALVGRRGARRKGPRQRGVTIVPAFAGLGRPPLGPRRAGRDCRGHARHDGGAPRARLRSRASRSRPRT